MSEEENNQMYEEYEVKRERLLAANIVLVHRLLSAFEEGEAHIREFAKFVNLSEDEAARRWKDAWGEIIDFTNAKEYLSQQMPPCQKKK